MHRPAVLGIAALALVAGAIVVLPPERLPPARVWALETPGGDGLPMPVRIAARPGGSVLDVFDLASGCGGGGMGGNVIHFLRIRRGVVSRMLDAVREPPLATLGYGRRNHVVRAADGEWRELVRRGDDGREPPVEGGAELAGRWEHVAGDGRTASIDLRADGTLEVTGDEGQGDWTRAGTTVVLALVLPRDGVWPAGADRQRDDAVCELTPDGTSYAGADHEGRAVRGRRTVEK